MLREQACCLLLGLLFGDRNHLGGHDIFDFHGLELLLLMVY
jgi:hypothetical protein